jgi:hypothetical protein
MKVLLGNSPLTFSTFGVVKLRQMMNLPVFLYQGKLLDDDMTYNASSYVKIDPDSYEGVSCDEIDVVYAVDVDLGDEVSAEEFENHHYSLDTWLEWEQRIDPSIIRLWEKYGDRLFNQEGVRCIDIPSDADVYVTTDDSGFEYICEKSRMWM